MKRYIPLALAVLALAACNKNAEPETPVYGKIRVEPVITKATEVNFEAGDKIGLTIAPAETDAKYADNACLTFDGSVFSGDLEWYADAYMESDVYAYYPYDSVNPDTYALFEDQTEGIAQADFMAASKKGVLPGPNAVTMVFKHMMTKLVINVDNQSGADITGLTVSGGVLATGIDLANMRLVEPSGALPDVVPQVIAYEAVAGEQWQAIIIPCKTALELGITLSNGKYLTQPLAEMTLKSGGQYTINARLLEDNMLVSASGEIENWTDEGEIGFEGEGTTEDLPVEFTEYEDYFVYDGVEYATTVFADGNKWMTENLAFVPRGMEVSGDASDANGIWYPYAVTDGVAAALTDAESVKMYGYLYDYPTAFGVEEITADNMLSFEGTQGICPKGWHIPTRDEYLGLCGLSNNNPNVGETGNVINEEAPFYDPAYSCGSLVLANAAGFNFVPTGIVSRTAVNKSGSYSTSLIDSSKNAVDESWNGRPALTYFMASTGYQLNNSGTNIQFFGMMTTFTHATSSYGKLNCGYTGYLSGYPLRCVKDN